MLSYDVWNGRFYCEYHSPFRRQSFAMQRFVDSQEEYVIKNFNPVGSDCFLTLEGQKLTCDHVEDSYHYDYRHKFRYTDGHL